MAHQTKSQAVMANLLGHSPAWYKLAIVGFLIANPLLLLTVGPFITGWVLIAEFIFTLAMALKCYPLPAGGLLAVEAVIMGMTTAERVYEETVHNFPVILLLMFMVAGIYFMKDLLQLTFTKLLVRIRSKYAISLLFCFAGAFLSAFLDALTVTAVIISVAYGFFAVYHKYVSSKGAKTYDIKDDGDVEDLHVDDLENFRGYLRNLMMHGAVGTALGGVCTLVGEPQNLLIGHEMGWHFVEFFIQVAPVSMPVLVVGLATCLLVERFKVMGYGYRMPDSVRTILTEEADGRAAKMNTQGRAALVMQALMAVFLIVALALHLAEVGLVGLTVIVGLTAFNGITEEHRIGHAFEEALPFTALLVVFFAIVAVIHEQHLFAPVLHLVLGLKGHVQLAAYYVANGLLSAISDNVFVATVYITETKMHFAQLLAQLPGIDAGSGLIDMLTDPHASRAEVLTTLPQQTAAEAGRLMAHFDKLAVAINTGTNIPSVATPNGQAAFLFLLTSALAPVIRLSYGQMVKLALPYTFTMSLAGLAAIWWLL